MIPNYKHIARLIQRYHDGTLSDAQRSELLAWISQHDNNSKILENAGDWNFLKKELELYHAASERSSTKRISQIQSNVLSRIETYPENNTDHTGHRKQLSIKRLYVPISMVACCLIILWFVKLHDQRKSDSINIELSDPALVIKPAPNTATITLPNGDQISLVDEDNTILVGETITYADGRNLAGMTNMAVQDTAMLTLTTPPKTNYHVKLSDGSDVWINENSTLRYPMKFGRTDRTVELKGEAFFSVQKSEKGDSFLVRSKNQIVRVLGTQFNLSTESERNLTKTTLIEGEVELQSALNAQKKKIKPNQQAIFNGKGFQLKNVNVEPIIAWKSGNFYFDGEDPTLAFREISRWYDIQIVYQKTPKLSFFGYIEKSNDLATVLKILKDSGLQFKIHKDGKQLLLKIINE